MTHERNVNGLRSSAEKRHQEARIRTDEAIHRLIRDRKPINFNTVSETAGVSTAFLYKQDDIRRRIEQLRGQQRSQAMQTKKPTDVSSDSKDAIIETLRARIRKLAEENKNLKQQVEIAYGQLHRQNGLT